MEVTISIALKMQELSGLSGDTSALQFAMFLFSKCAFLQDTNNAFLLSRSAAVIQAVSFPVQASSLHFCSTAHVDVNIPS